MIEGIIKMGIGSLGLIISGISCYMYLKEGVKIKKNKMNMRAARKSMYMKNEVNISKCEINSFKYVTDYLDEVGSVSANDTEILDSGDFIGNETDFLNGFDE